jgi:SRSO17 transposase
MRRDAPAVERWGRDFKGLLTRVGPCFGRHDLRAPAGGYVRGLLGRVDRKNGWQVAEYLGDPKPYGVQRLLGRARWDADRLRDEVRRYAAEHLLGGGKGGVLVVDETGFLKKRCTPTAGASGASAAGGCCGPAA